MLFSDLSADDKTPVASPSSFTDYHQQGGSGDDNPNTTNKNGKRGFVVTTDIAQLFRLDFLTRWRRSRAIAIEGK